MELPTSIEEWTIEDVHQWLIKVVKVHETYANRFRAEEVSGDSFVVFEKKDILDLNINHGPAVKIKCYLESLKEGSQHQSQIPAYVRNWTKEQVNQWLLQHVKLHSNYAERLQEEGVSGDCLVCFKKQDFLDLGLKSGPAVKILAELSKLDKKPEPALQPIPHTSTEQKESPKHMAITQPDSYCKTESQTDKMVEKESVKAQPPFQTLSEMEEIQQPKQQDLGARRKTPIVSTVPSDKQKITVEIQETLASLSKDDLKLFHFRLQDYSELKQKRIPKSKLEDKDTIDTATLLIRHYGSEEALQVTKDILRDINQRELLLQLEKKTDPVEQESLSKSLLKKEANQGDKLKDLLTCGGNSLDNYAHFIVVVNKSRPDQVQYFQFLKRLKPFCVLDFDPHSVDPGGLCHSYRESRVANLHTPSQYKGPTDTVIKSLNLHKQTSWVFCNGRHDLDGDSNKQLDYKNWLRKSCKDVEELVSFICNPEVISRGESLIIFLLLSPVDTEKDPIFDIYKSFIKHTDEESIINICESQTMYEKWRELVQEKCDSDIDLRSIYELTLGEVNGTVMALGPFNQSSERLLPSYGSSCVVLKQKEEDLLTALDILCLNQCENTMDEKSTEFHGHRLRVEEEFYKGGKVNWWNFYFCYKDKARPFVKRDKYENVKKIIRSQLRDSKNMCSLLNLFHHPGCGGTTLAMHVMWDLRQEVRCAVLKDNTLPKKEVARQVSTLMKLESEKPFSVLLLVDDSKDSENPHELVNCIEYALNMNVGDTPSVRVIILNCVRSHNPKEQYQRDNTGQSQYITASLTQEEQEEFEKKLRELKETHETPENFYSFMIMKSNFDKKYIKDLAHNMLENFDCSSKEARLFTFLVLLNTYLAGSEISLSLCQDFLGMKMVEWKRDSIMGRMEPYSNFLIVDTVEDLGRYKGIRILHHSIASACLEELEKSYFLKVSDITMEILHCDLFFSVGVVKHRFMGSIHQMLIERQRKKGEDGREQFSSLVGKIHKDQGRQTVQDIFVKASSRFVTSASIPQALARYLYIMESDFPEALQWAEKAKNIKQNQYTFDTIGQIHKSNLKSNNFREKQETSRNQEDLKTNIQIAENAIAAFKRAQELANEEDEPEREAADDVSEDYPRKSYNVCGYVGVLDVALLVFEILSRLPFFEESDPMKKKYLQSFLEKTILITNVYKEDNEINNRYVEIIKEHQQFLQSLKTEVKEIFEFFSFYITNIKKITSESDFHEIVSVLFKKYATLFCPTSNERKEEQEHNPRLNLEINIEERRWFLEENYADTFAGILQHLDKPAIEIERITECYGFLLQQQFINQKQKTKETINYILSNIVLYILKPKFKHVESHSSLSALLLQTLQEVGLRYPFPDPYYLALLLLWPRPGQEDTEIGTYVRAIRKSKRMILSYRIRNTMSIIYLGKGEGLKRLVSKRQLDENFKEMRRDTRAELWRNGDIFRKKAIIKRLQRVSGTTEQGELFANYGKGKIPVRPALIGAIRSGSSTEKVSFYLGFAINGPLAYDIQYEN